MQQIKALHIANWYPNPWDDIEGNFVKAQYDLFRQVTNARLINVQVRATTEAWLEFRCLDLGVDERGYYLRTKLGQARLQALLTTILLLFALVREKAWRYDLLHVHIAWPLLAHMHLWKRIIGKPILISEHWSAYHYKFHLPDGSAAVRRMRRPFRQGVPVIAVSKALLDDIRAFAETDQFSGYVIPNVVPLHGCRPHLNRVPVLFTVNRWNAIKDPMPMLEGLIESAQSGAEFELVIGGFGPLRDEMEHFIRSSLLVGRTKFLDKMTKGEIAGQLTKSDGYVFSSKYETFSVACAEALGAGVPLIGPYIGAIAEYAGPDEWELVERRDARAWKGAICRFLKRVQLSQFDYRTIAARAATRFSPQHIQDSYLVVLGDFMNTQQAVRGTEKNILD